MFLLICKSTELLIQVTATICWPRQDECCVLESSVLPSSNTLLYPIMRNPRGHEEVPTWNLCPSLRPCPWHLKLPDSTSWDHVGLLSRSVFDVCTSGPKTRIGCSWVEGGWQGMDGTFICSISIRPLDDKEQEGKSHRSASHFERDLMIQRTENSKF